MAEAVIARLQDKITQGRCPVCDKSYGVLHPRGAVMNHLRRKRDPAHKLFKEQFWSDLFPVGFPHKKHDPHSVEDHLEGIVKQFGINAVQKAVTNFN